MDDHVKSIKLLCVISLVIALLSSYYQFFEILPESGKIDLRNRIIGARLLDTQHSPYTYKWKEGDSERLLDPIDVFNTMPVSRVTVTPAMLMVHKSLAALSYPSIITIWTSFQVAIFLFFLFWTVRRSDALTVKYLLIITGCLFAVSLSWVLHLVVGQIYIVYSFIILLAMIMMESKHKYLHVLSGVLVGMCIFFRPNFALIFLPFLFTLHYRMLAGGVIGAIVGLLIFVMPNMPLWELYVEAMDFWSQYNFHNHFWNKPEVLPTLPDTIEGIANLHKTFHFNASPNSSIQYFVFTALGIKLNALHLLSIFLLFIGGFYLSVRKRMPQFQIEDLFIMGMFFFLIFDFAIPAPRFEYYSIQWLLPILLIVKRLPLKITPIHVLLFSGILLSVESIPWIFGINERIAQLLLFSGVVLFFVQLPIRVETHKKSA